LAYSYVLGSRGEGYQSHDGLVDDREPQGRSEESERVVSEVGERFVATLKERVRGRIGVGSEEVKKMFEASVEELKAVNRGKALEGELTRLEVEVLSVVSL